MSTFNGFFEKIPFISVDCFKKENVEQSKILFLSHCHADHMQGLEKTVDLQIPLYTSEISALFLKKQYGHLSNIEILSIKSPTQLNIKTDDGKLKQLLVTAIPAHHCPGSVMFLFQTHTSTILYTGDFRILKSQFKRFPMLTDQKINKMYVDSTFLNKKFMEFPSQLESSNAICNLVSEWLEANTENQILIEMPAQYGIEFLFINIGKNLKQKIFVNPNQWNKYCYFPNMDGCISHNKKECRIEIKQKLFGRLTESHLRIIMPTAFWWKNWKKGQPIVKEISKNKFRVAYSSHCSCKELKDFLEFVKPEEVFFNVVHPPDNEEELKNCLSSIYDQKSICIKNQLEAESVCEIKFDKIQEITKIIKRNHTKSETFDLLPKRLKN